MQENDTSLRGYIPAMPAHEVFLPSDPKDFPYLNYVPKDLEANLLFRKKTLTEAAKNPTFRAALRQKCADNLLFWVNTFAWLIEPRSRDVIPFITYPFQDRALTKIRESLGHHDLVMVKSRDQGGTWMVMTVFTHEWQFFSHSEFQLTSRVENDVDTQGDYGKLLPKADWIVENQPTWLSLLPSDYSRKHLSFQNLTNKSLFQGYATNPHSGRGTRRRGTLYDEFAAVEASVSMATLATSQAVGTRIWCSTPVGPSGAFATVAHDKNIARIDLDWSEHPQKYPGLYSSSEGKLQVLEPDETGFRVCDFRVPNYEAKDGTIREWPLAQRGFPPEYKFVLDGKRRSPWYDFECRRSGVPQHIAQELDRDFLRSGAQFFDQLVLDTARKGCRVPEYIGSFAYESDTGNLLTDAKGRKRNPLDAPGSEKPNGLLRLWANLCEPYVDAANPEMRDLGVAPRDITTGVIDSDAEYALGVDISAGAGSSNSAIMIIDCHTGEVVGEFADPHLKPHELAALVVAMGKWLNNALVIWDGAGPTGSMFKGAFLKKGYHNFWMRRTEDHLNKKVSDVPGWFGKGQLKAELLNAVVMGMGETTLRIYSHRVLDEASEYVYAPNGSPEHASVPGNKDPTAAGAAHGDRVMALALAWRAAPGITAVEEQPERIALPGSLAYRREQATREKPDDKRLIRGELVV